MPMVNTDFPVTYNFVALLGPDEEESRSWTLPMFEENDDVVGAMALAYAEKYGATTMVLSKTVLTSVQNVEVARLPEAPPVEEPPTGG